MSTDAILNQLSTQLSTASKAVEPSITMQISAMAQEMRKEGKNVIGFGAGEPDFDTPDFIKEAGKQAIDAGKTKYTAAAGITELKEAICQKFQNDQGLSYTPDEIVVSCGAKHSVYNVMLALLNPGDEVIIPAPYWVSYPQQANLLSAKSVVVPTSYESQYKITPEQLESAITEKSKLLILNSPSNPTGMVYTRSELEALAVVIEKHGLYVMSDEIYEKLIYEGEHISIASISEAMKALTIVVNGVSKAYSMTGWRVGYTASALPIAKAMSKMQSHMTSNPTSISQWASLEALQGPQEILEVMGAAFKKRRDIMMAAFEKMPGISCIQPQGAFYVFPKISETFGKSSPSGPITDSVSFCERLLTDEQVACVPGAGFGEDSCMRLSYATSEDAIDDGLARLERFLLSLQ